MRVEGRPSGETVATIMAVGSFSPKCRASLSQRANCSKGFSEIVFRVKLAFLIFFSYVRELGIHIISVYYYNNERAKGLKYGYVNR